MWLIVSQLPHESWLVRCSPRTPDFSCKQSASIPLILQEPGDVTSTHPCDPPPPSFSHANLVAIRENIFSSSRELNQSFRSGSSTSQPPCYISMLCYVINFTDFFKPPTQSSTDLGHTPLFSCCIRHFSLPHHVPIFNRIHPLGRQDRHVWQIIRQLAGEMLPSRTRIYPWAICMILLGG